MSTTRGGSLSQASTHRLQGISMTTSYVSPHLQTTQKNQDFVTCPPPVSLTPVPTSLPTYFISNPENPETFIDSPHPPDHASNYPPTQQMAPSSILPSKAPSNL